MVTAVVRRLCRLLAGLALAGVTAIPLLTPNPAQAWGRGNAFVSLRVGIGAPFFAPGPFFAPRPFFVGRPFLAPRPFFVQRPFFVPRPFFGPRVLFAGPVFTPFFVPARRFWVPPFWNG